MANEKKAKGQALVIDETNIDMLESYIKKSIYQFTRENKK